MSPNNGEPNIGITLNGLHVVFVKKKECRVGVLGQAPPGHVLKITVKKADANGKFQPFTEIHEADVNKNLKLTISNTSTTGITRRKMDVPIDRLTGPAGGNEDSFRWVVDFESEIYHKRIGAKKAGFKSILTLNNGELLTRKRSANKLIIKRGVDDPGTLFGVVATQTGIDIVLDRPKSKAAFKNGRKVIFTANSQEQFRIFIDRGCSNESGGSDADSYYTAIGGKVPPSEKIFFTSTALPRSIPPIDPDAACLNAHLSQSQPG